MWRRPLKDIIKVKCEMACNECSFWPMNISFSVNNKICIKTLCLYNVWYLWSSQWKKDFLSKRASFFLQPAQRKVFQSIPPFIPSFLHSFFLSPKSFSIHRVHLIDWKGPKKKFNVYNSLFDFSQSFSLSIFPSSLYLYTSTSTSASVSQ